MASRDTRARLEERAARYGLTLDATFVPHLITYYELLQRWNRTINLTALRDSDEAIDRLLLEPLAAARHLPAAGHFLDVGTGGGSPAIPLAIALSPSTVTMVESKGRKAAFLREAIRELELPGARVEEGRVEDLASRVDLREQATLISVLAVKLDQELVDGLTGFLSSRGLIAFFLAAGADVPFHHPHLRDVNSFPLLDPAHGRLALLQRVI